MLLKCGPLRAGVISVRSKSGSPSTTVIITVRNIIIIIEIIVIIIRTEITSGWWWRPPRRYRMCVMAPLSVGKAAFHSPRSKYIRSSSIQSSQLGTIRKHEMSVYFFNSCPWILYMGYNSETSAYNNVSPKYPFRARCRWHSLPYTEPRRHPSSAPPWK